MNQTIAVKTKGNQAIVHKTLYHPTRRYALTKEGQWVLVPEGQAYPEECILATIEYDENPALYCPDPSSLAEGQGQDSALKDALETFDE